MGPVGGLFWPKGASPESLDESPQATLQGRGFASVLEDGSLLAVKM